MASFFQFHKGAIETRQRSLPSKTRVAFNSIKVRLKPHIDKGLNRSIEPFNSIKVRLKHHKTDRERLAHHFQFHKGAIETQMACSCFYLCELSIP